MATARATQLGGNGGSRGPERGTDRLYQRIARLVFDELARGKYAVGDRLPAERDLAEEHNVSRPVVREAMIALEVQGLVEVRLGAGAYVRRLPQSGDSPAFNVTGFELTEARLLFEGEAAALAATQITDEELDRLDALVDRIAAENAQPSFSDAADRDFHLLIAAATRNALIARTIEYYWDLRSSSPECALLHRHARDADMRPVVDHHRTIAAALRAHDPAAARAAMRSHLSHVLDDFLVASEEEAVARAREGVATNRERARRSGGL
ncbi:MAG: FadR family transcriptional regulator [Alphaproteobacteria bacterium]|nr:FadR family transcriptional regulator [Alphaproteobacteria bacterium]